MSVNPPKPRRRRPAAPRAIPANCTPPISTPPDSTTARAGRSAGEETAASTQTAENNAGQVLEKTLEALSVDETTARRIQKLPHDVGWLLVTAGIVGVVMPGVLGVPFLALGGLILLPGTNRKAERWLSGQSPNIFKGSIRQINRFLDDLERRYPQIEKKNEKR